MGTHAIIKMFLRKTCYKTLLAFGKYFLLCFYLIHSMLSSECMIFLFTSLKKCILWML